MAHKEPEGLPVDLPVKGSPDPTLGPFGGVVAVAPRLLWLILISLQVNVPFFETMAFL